MACVIEQQMSLDELYEWGAWFELKYEAEKKAMDEAKRNAKRK